MLDSASSFLGTRAVSQTMFALHTIIKRGRLPSRFIGVSRVIPVKNLFSCSREQIKFYGGRLTDRY